MAQPPASSRLFPDAPAHPPGGVHLANIDGASRGNPGPASYAIIFKDGSGRIVFQLGKKIGRRTNHEAEYYALLAALDYAVGHGIKGLRLRSDSELLVQQMKGYYRVKSPDLKPLHERASKLARQLEYFVIEHVPREMNREADALANQALDEGSAPAEPSRGSHSPTSERPQGATPRNRASCAGTATQTVRARFVNGALVPLEPVHLDDGSEVTLTIRK